MSLPAYPTSLPLPEVNGYAQFLSPHFDATPVDTGEPFFRERDPIPTWIVQVNWTFDQARSEWTNFQNFYEKTINRGLDWFTLDLLIGEGLFSHECHFAEPSQPWQMQATGGLVYNVNAALIARFNAAAIFPALPPGVTRVDPGTPAAPSANRIDAGYGLSNLPTDIYDAGSIFDY